MPARHYFIRGKPVMVEEVPGVFAVKLKLQPGEELTDDMRRAAAEALGGEISVSMPDVERGAFYRAAWLFVRLPRGTDSIPSDVRVAHVGQVFQQGSGRTLIGNDRLIVKLHPKMPPLRAREVLEQADVSIVRGLRFAPNLYEVQVPKARDFLQVAVELHQRREFEYAEPAMFQYIGRRGWWSPSDPRYKDQWQWRNLVNAGADVSAEIAWQITRGNGTRIAVIDYGFDVNHPDLSPRIDRVNSGYFESQDDGGLFVAGVNGFPDYSHGTFCAGMAAAEANNKEGGCGIANEATLLLIACPREDNEITLQSALARAIGYAVDPRAESQNAHSRDGAWVISCSLGLSDTAPLESVLANALDGAVTQGRVGLGTPVFWAASYDRYSSVDDDPVCGYAAVIAVGCSTQDDRVGPTASGSALEFLAPGVNVVSTTSRSLGYSYGGDAGTSYATPCAAGIAALVLAVRPDLWWQDLRDILRDTCDKIEAGAYGYGPDGRNKTHGYGRVNAGKAVVQAQSSAGSASPAPAPTPTTVTITVTTPASLLT